MCHLVVNLCIKLNYFFLYTIDEDAAFKSRFRSIKCVPFNEPWFTKKSKPEVEHLLFNNFHVDGYFLVNPDYSKDNSVLALYLNVMFGDALHQFKIIQVIDCEI